MKKKSILFGVLALTSLARIQGIEKTVTVPKGDESPSRVLTGNESIELSKPKFAQNADGSFTETVHYTLQPAGIAGVKFYTTLDWVQSNSDYYDWKTLDNTKNVEDYVTYQRDYTNQNISFTCKQAFGRQLRFERALQDDTSKTAVIIIDYSRKRLEKATVSRTTATEFTDGKPIFIKVNKAKFSVGTTGSTDEITKVQVGYRGDSIATLLGDIDEPTSSTSITYNGKTYPNTAGLKSSIAAAYEKYLYSVISDDNPTVFWKENFKALGAYSYTHFGTRNTRSQFITNYRKAFETGKTGFYVRVTVSNEVIYEQGINFSNNPSRLDSFTPDKTNIVF